MLLNKRTYYDYGFGELGNKLIDVLKDIHPDFKLAQELVDAGADVNMLSSKYGQDCMLEEILPGYWNTYQRCCEIHDMDRDICDDCKYASDMDVPVGQYVVDIVRFMLKNGLNVEKYDGELGAKCLHALVFSTNDEKIIEAAKLLLNAGARDKRIEEESVLDRVGFEELFLNSVQCDYAQSNIYEALYQLLLASRENRDYRGVDFYGAAVVTTITQVLAVSDAKDVLFFSREDNEADENYYQATLCFKYDTGYLISNRYADAWVNTYLPEGNVVDVSDRFREIIGNKVTDIAFDCLSESSYQKRPVLEILFDNRRLLKLTSYCDRRNNEDEYSGCYSIDN